MWKQWIDEGGGGRRFLPLPNIHLLFSPVLNSSSASISFFFHPLTVFLHRYCCFPAGFEPLPPQHLLLTAKSENGAHPPPIISVKCTWRWTTGSIKWCEKRRMGPQKYLSWAKILMNDERVSVFMCCVSWDGLEQCKCPHMTFPCFCIPFLLLLYILIKVFTRSLLLASSSSVCVAPGDLNPAVEALSWITPSSNFSLGFIAVAFSCPPQHSCCSSCAKGHALWKAFCHWRTLKVSDRPHQ